jgi:hypothetical protein
MTPSWERQGATRALAYTRCSIVVTDHGRLRRPGNILGSAHATNRLRRGTSEPVRVGKHEVQRWLVRNVIVAPEAGAERTAVPSVDRLTSPGSRPARLAPLQRIGATCQHSAVAPESTPQHLASAALLAVSMASAVFAAQPANPGCFGTDRAAWLHANGGAAWGAITPTRAADNGAIDP